MLSFELIADGKVPTAIILDEGGIGVKSLAQASGCYVAISSSYKVHYIFACYSSNG